MNAYADRDSVRFTILRLEHVSCGGASWRRPTLMLFGPDLEAEHRARMRDAVSVRSAFHGCLRKVHRTSCLYLCSARARSVAERRKSE